MAMFNFFALFHQKIIQFIYKSFYNQIGIIYYLTQMLHFTNKLNIF